MPQRGSPRKVATLAVRWHSFLVELFGQTLPLSLLLFGQAFGTTAPSWQNPPVVAAVRFDLVPLVRRRRQSGNAVLM
jgi:hypothetical protein